MSSSKKEGKKVMRIKQINKELLNACIAENVDLSYIEDLLKQGAQPLGAVDWDTNLYDAVLEH